MPTRVRDRLFSHYLGSAQSWQERKSFFPPPDGNIYARANRLGRERDGALDREATEGHLVELSATLIGLQTATGEAAVSEIVRPLGAYGPGAGIDLLPDLVVKPAIGLNVERLRLPDGREIRAPRRGWRDGEHLQTGFFLTAGPGNETPPPRLRSEEFARYACATVGISL